MVASLEDNLSRVSIYVIYSMEHIGLLKTTMQRIKEKKKVKSVMSKVAQKSTPSCDMTPSLPKSRWIIFWRFAMISTSFASWSISQLPRHLSKRCHLGPSLSPERRQTVEAPFVGYTPEWSTNSSLERRRVEATMAGKVRTRLEHSLLGDNCVSTLESSNVFQKPRLDGICESMKA